MQADKKSLEICSNDNFFPQLPTTTVYLPPSECNQGKAVWGVMVSCCG